MCLCCACDLHLLLGDWLISDCDLHVSLGVCVIIAVPVFNHRRFEVLIDCLPFVGVGFLFWFCFLFLNVILKFTIFLNFSIASFKFLLGNLGFSNF